MEQIVWLYFGLISVILALGIVGSLVLNFQEENKMKAFDGALDRLAEQCNFVCRAPRDTLLSIGVDLPSGLYLETARERICGEFEGERRCVRCLCVLDPYALELNSTLAMRSFDIQNYRCAFERGAINVSMECQG